MRYRVGDPVIYEGERYYVVDGPIMGSEGLLYRLSKIPPEITINESQIQPAPPQ